MERWLSDAGNDSNVDSPGNAVVPPTDEGEAPSAPSGAWAGQVIVDTIPVIGSRVAETIVAEPGCDMSRFPSAGRASSWAGLAPSQHESAGKRKATCCLTDKLACLTRCCSRCSA
jgi:Transposase IS116/IS110/IS902 family